MHPPDVVAVHDDCTQADSAVAQWHTYTRLNSRRNSFHVIQNMPPPVWLVAASPSTRLASSVSDENAPENVDDPCGFLT